MSEGREDQLFIAAMLGAGLDLCDVSAVERLERAQAFARERAERWPAGVRVLQVREGTYIEQANGKSWWCDGMGRIKAFDRLKEKSLS